MRSVDKLSSPTEKVKLILLSSLKLKHLTSYFILIE